MILLDRVVMILLDCIDCFVESGNRRSSSARPFLHFLHAAELVAVGARGLELAS
jgi:hypothetical protein